MLVGISLILTGGETITLVTHILHFLFFCLSHEIRLGDTHTKWKGQESGNTHFEWIIGTEVWLGGVGEVAVTEEDAGKKEPKQQLHRQNETKRQKVKQARFIVEYFAEILLRAIHYTHTHTQLHTSAYTQTHAHFAQKESSMQNVSKIKIRPRENYLRLLISKY